MTSRDFHLPLTNNLATSHEAKAGLYTSSPGFLGWILDCLGRPMDGEFFYGTCNANRLMAINSGMSREEASD